MTQYIVPPDAAPCEEPRSYDTMPVSMINPGLKALDWFAHLRIKTLRDLDEYLEQGHVLQDLKGIGPVTEAKILSELERRRRTTKATEELRRRFA